MKADALDLPAIAVFIAFFALVTVLGFIASRWKAGDLLHLHEWGLGGRRFGIAVSWFLIGGDFYTAYTVIAVPALVYSVGAYGFFALPFTIIVYPFIFLVMPKLWTACHRGAHVTAADFVQSVYGGKWFAAAIAATGIIATMPYIALQLVGMQVVIKSLGIHGELPLIAAFLILAAYTYTSGLRAPAMIAFVKDIMIYIVVIVIVALIPARLGSYGAVFEAANRAFLAKGGMTGIILHPSQFSAYATLALGSALAAFMYPHTMTGVLSASSADTVKKNAVFLPAYTLLLGLIALLGFMAIAAGIQPEASSDVVPALIKQLFPSWFLGFSAAAIAISALVPAAVMSIGAANLFTRNLYKPFRGQNFTPAHETKNAKLASLLVKFGALTFILFLPTEYAIDLQLLGGIWILQIFPAIVFTLYTRRLKLPALFTGWLAGLVSGTALSAAQGLKPVVTLNFGGGHYPVYIGLIGFLINIAVTFMLSAVLPRNVHMQTRLLEPADARARQR